MGHRLRQLNRARWARARLARRIREASRRTFDGADGLVVAYGVPLPEDPNKMSDEELARYRRILSDYLE